VASGKKKEKEGQEDDQKGGFSDGRPKEGKQEEAQARGPGVLFQDGGLMEVAFSKF
jgi:hypothetical protein